VQRTLVTKTFEKRAVYGLQLTGATTVFCRQLSIHPKFTVNSLPKPFIRADPSPAMRFLRFKRWLTELRIVADGIDTCCTSRKCPAIGSVPCLRD